MISVIDLGISNIRSVLNSFRRIGCDPRVVDSAAAIDDPEVLVLPGVGAFGRAMATLRKQGFEPAIQRHVLKESRPLVGICLGMQLLADRSEESGGASGLGLIRGSVKRLEPHPPTYRVPNIGWLNVTPSKASAMFPAGTEIASFYHVHSYHLECDDANDVAATVEFGTGRVVSAVARENVFGVQFHPEKSQDAGLDLLDRLFLHLRSSGRLS